MPYEPEPISGFAVTLQWIKRRRIGATALAAVLAAANWPLAERALAQQPAIQTEPARQETSSAKSGKMFIKDVCGRIERAAIKWQLPPSFLARLIWKESRFDPNAISPVGASGIAQFMPGTASLRKLEDPFDPRTAIPASAHFLHDLRSQFGNLGLAAAAYNAGPNRVSRWAKGAVGLPRETQNYVTSITGHHPREWNTEKPPKVDFRLHAKLGFMEACSKLPIRNFKPRQRYASAPWQPWGAHVTADWSPSKALSHYAALQREYPGILGTSTPMVVRVVNYSFGRAPRFEIRIGKPDRARAKALCQKLQRAGGPCIVTKTPR